MVAFFIAQLCYSMFHLTAARKIHETVVVAITNATMKFFDTLPQGRLTSRVTHDTEMADVHIGRYGQLFFDYSSMVIGSLISVSITAWPCIILAVVSVMAYLTLWQRYRRVAPQLCRQ